MSTKPIDGGESSTVKWAGMPFSMVEASPLPIAMTVGDDHRLHYVNSAFALIIGKLAQDVVGTPISQIVPKNDPSLKLLDGVLRSALPVSHTEEQHSPTHPLFWSYTMWPVMAEGRPVGVVIQVTETAQIREKTVSMNEALISGLVRQHELAEAADAANVLLKLEIKERKAAEESLRQAQELLTNRAGQLEELVTKRTAELTATNGQMEAFVYSIAHDLRAPLRTMKAFSSILLEESEGTLSDNGKDYASRINRSAEFMDAMLVDLLAFSKISQQNVEPASSVPKLSSWISPCR